MREGLQQPYGVEAKYTYAVYTPFDVGFKEIDRIADGAAQYEIKAIQRWHTYYKLTVEECFL